MTLRGPAGPPGVSEGTDGCCPKEGRAGPPGRDAHLRLVRGTSENTVSSHRAGRLRAVGTRGDIARWSLWVKQLVLRRVRSKFSAPSPNNSACL